MSTARAALFDFDGTLLDTSPGIIRSAKAAAQQLHLPMPPDEAFRFFIGPPLIDSFRKVFGIGEQEAAEASELYKRIYDETGAVHEAAIYPGIVPLLHDLRAAGMKTAVASMKRTPLLKEMIDVYQMTDLFDAVSGAPMPPGRGNKPEIIRSALREIGSDAPHAVMIGDSDYDGDAAKATGTPFIGVLWGFGFTRPEEIAQYPGARVAASADDLRRLLTGDSP